MGWVVPEMGSSVCVCVCVCVHTILFYLYFYFVHLFFFPLICLHSFILFTVFYFTSLCLGRLAEINSIQLCWFGNKVLNLESWVQLWVDVHLNEWCVLDMTGFSRSRLAVVGQVNLCFLLMPHIRLFYPFFTIYRPDMFFSRATKCEIIQIHH